MLAENPHVLKRVREEILEKVGPSRRPTHDDLRDMKYLRAFINGEPHFLGYTYIAGELTSPRNTPPLPCCVSPLAVPSMNDALTAILDLGRSIQGEYQERYFLALKS